MTLTRSRVSAEAGARACPWDGTPGAIRVRARKGRLRTPAAI